MFVKNANMDTRHVIEEGEENEFSVSGMDDEVRENYKKAHPVGTVITIEYSGKTASGKLWTLKIYENQR